MKKILFVCTSNKDRSPTLESYFKKTNPQNEYKSAGVNKYFCEKKHTHYITESDIEWSDCVVFAEDIHYEIVTKKFNFKKDFVILNCGEYEQGSVGEEYLMKTKLKLKNIINYGMDIS